MNVMIYSDIDVSQLNIDVNKIHAKITILGFDIDEEKVAWDLSKKSISQALSIAKDSYPQCKIDWFVLPNDFLTD